MALLLSSELYEATESLSSNGKFSAIGRTGYEKYL